MRLAALIIRTARFKNAHGLPAILLALSRLLLPWMILEALQGSPDILPSLAGIIPKLLALVPW